MERGAGGVNKVETEGNDGGKDALGSAARKRSGSDRTRLGS